MVIVTFQAFRPTSEYFDHYIRYAHWHILSMSIKSHFLIKSSMLVKANILHKSYRHEFKISLIYCFSKYRIEQFKIFLLRGSQCLLKKYCTRVSVVWEDSSLSFAHFACFYVLNLFKIKYTYRLRQVCLKTGQRLNLHIQSHLTDA
jgi:hypothetical protein